MIYYNPNVELFCDACGIEIVTSNYCTYPNYDGVFHRQCANPEAVDGLLIGYNNVVVGVDETVLVKEAVETADARQHPSDCGCSWCVPLAWGSLTPAAEY